MSEINKTYKKYGQRVGKQYLELFYSFATTASHLSDTDYASYKDRFDSYVKKEYGQTFFSSFSAFFNENVSNQKLIKELDKYRTVYMRKAVVDLVKEPPKEKSGETVPETKPAPQANTNKQPVTDKPRGKATVLLDGVKAEISYDDPDKAIPVAQMAIFFHPHDADNWCVLGDLYSAKKEWKEAYVCYGRALVKDPRSARALHGKDKIEQQLSGRRSAGTKSVSQDTGETAASAQEAPAVKEESYFFENEMEFIIYCKVSQSKNNVIWKKGSEYLDEFQKGYKYIDQKQYPQAISAFKQALQLNPVGIAARFELCTAYSQMHDIAAARETLRDIEPYLYSDQLIAKYYRSLGYILVEEKNYKTAANAYQYSLFLDPDQPMAKQELLYIVNEAGFEVLDGISDRNKVEQVLKNAGIPLLRSVTD